MYYLYVAFVEPSTCLILEMVLYKRTKNGVKMNPFLELFLNIVDLYKFILVIWIVLSWLISFNIVNRYQPFVSRVYKFIEQLTDPVLRYLRKYIPMVGSVDITPVILFIVLNFLKNLLIYYVF